MDHEELFDWQEADRFSVTASDDPMFQAIKTAVDESRWLDVVYFGGNNPGGRRQIKPLEIYGVEGYSETYVRAFCSVRQEVRTFRLDRLTIVGQNSNSHTTPPAQNSSAHMDNADRVLQLLVATPGLKATHIASQLRLY